MCQACGAQEIGRRGFLKFGAGRPRGRGPCRRNRPAHAADGAPTALTPDEALAQLKADNDAFVENPELCSRNLAEQRQQVAGHQAPWATIVACADSRVPPELIFGGRGLGELFVARNAGNLVDVQTLGTLEYGSAVLGSPLIVVLAHTSCGAVKAACDVVLKNATYPGVIGAMIQPILPAALAVRGMDRRLRQQRRQEERRTDRRAASGAERADLRSRQGRQAQDRRRDLRSSDRRGDLFKLTEPRRPLLRNRMSPGLLIAAGSAGAPSFDRSHEADPRVFAPGQAFPHTW